jgi:predicted transcriptional regulator
MQLKKVKSTITELVDFETGELVDTSIKDISILIDKERFSLVYASFWQILTEANLSKSDIELFAHLVGEYASGTMFTITYDIKKLVSDKSGKSPSSYDKSTKKLLDAQFIIKEGKQSYIINPRYAYEGSSKNRKKLLVELACNHRIKI